MTIIIANVICVTFAFAEKKGAPPIKQPGNIQVHGNTNEKTQTSLIDILRKQKLANYTSATIGDAIDSYSYFSKVQWKEYPAVNNKHYFDVTGTLKSSFWKSLMGKDGVANRSLEVKFVIYPSGEYGVVLVTLIEFKHDGKIVKKPIADIKSVLDKIYGNQEVKLY